jgi:hypothetical protein
MTAPIYGIGFSISLFVGVLLLMEVGRRIGANRLVKEGDLATKGFGAVEGAVFALLGLVLAFSFSGALTRFDARRQAVVEESNDIGTAWLRVDLLPESARLPMKDLFRRYLDSRIETYKKVPDMAAVNEGLKRSADLQRQIWELGVKASHEAGTPQASMLLLPALNAMFDIVTTRTEAIRVHPPAIIFAMLGILTLACALFAGYDMGNHSHFKALHSVIFATVLAVTVYVIIDLEYPRLGLIRMTDSDQVLVDLRRNF